MAITLSSDYVYVLAMLKTTPLVVTIGLSLTMPLALLGDIGLHHPVKAQVILGAALVLVSFVVIKLIQGNAWKKYLLSIVVCSFYNI
jgi:solute carrier family 35, member F5